MSIESAVYNNETQIMGLTIKNNSDAIFLLKNNSNYTFSNSDDMVQVPAQGSKYLQVKTLKRLNQLILDFTVMNALVAPKQYAQITLKRRID